MIRYLFRCILPIIGLSLLLGCVERKADTQTKKESPVSGELSAMIDEYKQMRSWNDYPSAMRNEADLRHRQTVYQLLAQALIVEPVDLYRAAILLETPDSAPSAGDLMLAYYCALESARKGHNEARRLAAEYLDKYLIVSGLPQKYGTQSYRDSTGALLLYQFDSTTTDDDRAAWDVQPLESLKSLLNNK